jgi:hypothetical protein
MDAALQAPLTLTTGGGRGIGAATPQSGTRSARQALFQAQVEKQASGGNGCPYCESGSRGISMKTSARL